MKEEIRKLQMTNGLGRRSKVGSDWQAAWAGPKWCFYIGLFVCLIQYLYHAVQMITFPYAYDRGEGFVLTNTTVFLRGMWPYKDWTSHPFTASNYPPVYQILAAMLARFVGESLISGRVLSFVSALVAALVVFIVVRNVTESRWIGLVAGLLFLVNPYIYHWGSLFRVDMLSVALILIGLYFYDRYPDSRLHYLSIPVLVAATYVKPTAMIAFAAIGITLLWKRSGRSALIYLSLSSLAVLIPFLILDRVTSGWFYFYVIAYNTMPFSLGTLLHNYPNFIATNVILNLLILGGTVLRYYPTDKERSGKISPIWSTWYLLTLVSGLTSGRWGASSNYFLLPVASTTIMLGLLLPDLLKGGRLKWVYAALVLQLAVFMGVYFVRLPNPSSEDVAAGDRILSYVKSTSGPILTEELSFALADARPFTVNPLLIRGLWAMGLFDEGPLVRDIQDQRFGLVILEAHDLPPPVLKAIYEEYSDIAQIHMGRHTYRILKPKESAHGS